MRTHVCVFIAWFNNLLIMHKGARVRSCVSADFLVGLSLSASCVLCLTQRLQKYPLFPQV